MSKLFLSPIASSNIFGAFLLVCALGAADAASAQTILRFSPSQGSLQVALDAVPDGGTIELAAGTYDAPPGGFTIFPDLNGATKSFTVRAEPGANVVLNGGGTTEILTFTTPKPVTFQGLTFANGVSTREFHGGGMSTDHVQANFISCTFENNAGNAPNTGGGGLWLASSTVSFQSCTWRNNTSKHYGGGLSADQSRVYIRDSTFVGNRVNVAGHSFFSAGGAINGNASTIRIDNTRFESNQAGYVGGAIYVYGGWKDPVTTPRMNLVVSNSLFIGNFVLKTSGTFTAPTAGGAIQLEDQTKGTFYNCRFISNNAKQGGAVASYRTVSEFQGCVFQNNEAHGNDPSDGFGGAIFVISDDLPGDSTVNGTVNRPSAKLTVMDSLFRGPGGGAISARQGGAIFVAGDLHSMYGQGVNKNGTLETNRAPVNLQRVVFADLNTLDNGNGTGGALTADFVTLNANQCIVQNCSASQYGGGFEIVRGSAATITNMTFVNNRAGILGGALTMFGGTLNVSNSKFLDNRAKVSGIGGGSALMTSADPAGGSLPPMDMSGAIENCVMSNNSGGPMIYDGDSHLNGPYNRLQYNGNTIYDAEADPFFHDLAGYMPTSVFNNLKLVRADRTTTTKAAVPNISSAPAVTGALLMVPRQIVSSGAPGENLPIPAYLGYASSGGTPSLDGVAKGSAAAVVNAPNDGAHTLDVGASRFSTSPVPAAALNISTRLPVAQGDGALIGGFIVVGPTPKRLMVRAIGPSLPIAGALENPFLELHNSTGATIATNDSWRTTQPGGILGSSQVIDVLASTIPPSSDAEAAIIATLDPGAYTAVIRGAANSTGIALVEIFDLDPVQDSTLANISTRGFIQTNDNVMIGGFIYLGGPGPTKVVVRGIGPSLATAGIPNPLLDPMLELYESNGALVAANDDASQSPDAAALQATGLQPQNPAESAIYRTALPRGAYTAIARGKNNGTGVGLIEVYVFE